MSEYTTHHHHHHHHHHYRSFFFSLSLSLSSNRSFWVWGEKKKKEVCETVNLTENLRLKVDDVDDVRPHAFFVGNIKI
jgi:hypothetical protein